MNLMQRTGRSVSALRHERGQALGDVASSVGIEERVLWTLEIGRASTVDLALLGRLAEYFGVTVGFLVGDARDLDRVTAEIVALHRLCNRLRTKERKLIRHIIESLLERSASDNSSPGRRSAVSSRQSVVDAGAILETTRVPQNSRTGLEPQT